MFKSRENNIQGGTKFVGSASRIKYMYFKIHCQDCFFFYLIIKKWQINHYPSSNQCSVE